jgi:heme A synthase
VNLSQGPRLRRIRSLARLLTALSLLVVLVSAYLRLEGAGLGCADWPACYARLLALPPAAPDYGIARLLHRTVASLSLLLACALAWQCWRRPALRPVAFPATLLLLLMLALSALGIWSSDPRLTLVNLLNILGGLGLVSFSWRVVLASESTVMTLQRPACAPTVLLRLGAACLTLTVLLGALIGATYMASACTTFPDCQGRWWPVAAGWPAMSTLAVLQAAPQPGDPAGVNLHLLHRYAAVATLLLLGAAGLQALASGERRRAAALLLLLLVTTAALGILTVLAGFSLWMAVAHGACAAALLAALATLLQRG